AGGCSPGEVRSWVANRWYYQRVLAQKNAAVIAACPLPQVRRRWLDRIVFHDGTGEGDGGMADWLALADAVGLAQSELPAERQVRRGTRFAVDGYLHFCQTRPWTEAVAAALTEMFAPDLMATR